MDNDKCRRALGLDIMDKINAPYNEIAGPFKKIRALTEFNLKIKL